MPHLTIPVSTTDHQQGPASAPVTLVEYGDYECSYCGEAYPIIKQVQAHFGDRLRFVFRNFPLGQMHPHAQHAAEAAEDVALQGDFWAMHDLLYEHQDDLDDQHLGEYAQRAGADIGRFTRDFTAATSGEHIHADFNGGVRSGVNGTPSFFINGQRYDGDYQFASLVSAIEAAGGQ